MTFKNTNDSGYHTTVTVDNVTYEISVHTNKKGICLKRLYINKEENKRFIEKSVFVEFPKK